MNDPRRNDPTAVSPESPCCSGVDRRVPRPIENPPGRSELTYRVGEHADFFATMLAALSSRTVALEGIGDPITPLRDLATRSLDDPAVALLDAAAEVADVLTFYQERITNENYLRTATEDRSVAELGRLVGYAPRPGVSAGVPLAFELEQTSGPLLLAAGTRAQSVPESGQFPQSFETSQAIESRVEWNRLKPLTTLPQQVEPGRIGTRTLYFEGTATGLDPGDPLLLVFDPIRSSGLDEACELWRVVKIELDVMANRTAVHVQTWAGDDPVELEARRQTVRGAVARYPKANAAAIVPPYGFVRIDSVLSGSTRRDSEESLKALVSGAQPKLAPSLSEIPALVKTVNDAVVDQSRAADLIRKGITPLLPRLQQFVDSLKAAVAATPTSASTPNEIRSWYRDLRTSILDHDRLTFSTAPTGSASAEGSTTEHAASIGLRYLNAIDAAVGGVVEALDGDPAAALNAALARLNEIRTDLAAEPALTDLANRVLNDLIVPLTAARGKTAAEAVPIIRSTVISYAQGDPVVGKVQEAVVKFGGTLETGSTPARLDLQKTLADFHEALRLGGGLAPGDQPAGLTKPPPLKVLDDVLTSQATTLITEAFFTLIEDTLAQAESRDTGLLDRLSAVLLEIKANLAELGDFRFHDGDRTRLVDKLNQDVDPRNTTLREALRTRLEPIADTEPSKLDALLADALRVAAFARLVEVLRRESRLFDGGSFPRLRPFFDSFSAQVDALRRTALRQSQFDEPLSRYFLRTYQRAFGAEPTPSRGAKIQEVVDRLIEDDPYRSFLLSLIQSPSGGARPATRTTSQAAAFGQNSDLAARLLLDLSPELRDRFYPALARADVLGLPSLRQVEALRIVAAPFGSYAPPDVSTTIDDNRRTTVVRREWDLFRDITIRIANIHNDNVANHRVVVSVTSRNIERPQTFKPDTSESRPVEGFGTVTHSPVTGPPPGHQFEFSAGQAAFAITASDLGLPAGGTGNPFALTITPAGGKAFEPIRLTEGGTVTETSLNAGDFRLVVKSASLADGLLTIRLTTDDQAGNVLPLDSVQDKILPGSHVVLVRATPGLDPARLLQYFRVAEVATVSRADFGITAKISELTLDRPWKESRETSLADLRRIAVMAQGEILKLADEPYDADVRRDAIVLDDALPGLSPGRSILIEGERTDLPGTRGVRAAEQATIAQVEQITNLVPATSIEAKPVAPRPLGRPRTKLTLTGPLRFSYVRETAMIYGNVAPADHGETVADEILGGGDPTRAPQRFRLRQSPLTHVAAANESGVVPALEVRVDGVRWRLVDRLEDFGPTDRVYTLLLDERGAATVAFGDGTRGAQPPSGYDNIVARYRYGIGPEGNVAAGQISQLVTRPLGLKGVLNPLAATGGVGPDAIETARTRVSVGLRSLGRLVSVRDYEDFALSFAGIAKARAEALPGSQRRGIHVTVAAVGDAPLTGSSDLIVDLAGSLRSHGERRITVVVQPRWLRLILLSVRIEAEADRRFDGVAAAVRAVLFRRLAFAARGLAEDLVLSELTAVIQAVPGVVRSRIAALGLLDERNEAQGRPWTPDEISEQVQQRLDAPVPARLCLRRASLDPATGRIRPAELAYLSTTTPETLEVLPSEP